MAAATVTLSTTTLARSCGVEDRQVQLTSVTGLTPLMRIYVDKELMEVVSILPISDSLGTWVVARRGVDSMTTAHNAGAVVTLGTADQFYQKDPQGQPVASLYVSPWINTKTGSVWYAVGDDSNDPQTVNRWFQAQSTTYGQGGLGSRTVSQNPPENTAPVGG